VAAVLLSTSAAAREAPKNLLRDQQLIVDGVARTYDLYVPSDLGTKPRPLVLLLHGHIGDADVMTGENGKKAPYKVWLRIADREKLIVLIPDGEFGSDKKRGWNDCRADATTNPTTDDVTFLNKLIDVVAASHPVDRTRLYVTGTSNGGNMTYRLAAESPIRFAAHAPVVAAHPKSNECGAPTEPVSILIMNGTDDPLLPYAGGKVAKNDRHGRGEVVSTAETVAFWVRHNGIETPPQKSDLPDVDKRDAGTVHVERYTGGRNGTEVVLYEVRGGGHTEPSLTEHYGRLYKFIVGPQNRDVEMAEEVWKFFRDKQRE
jgi:polyhydroxybutyrate depolymerase